MVKIVHNRLLGGWFIVRGPHHTPIGGRFATKAEAKAWLERTAKLEARWTPETARRRVGGTFGT